MKTEKIIRVATERGWQRIVIIRYSCGRRTKRIFDQTGLIEAIPLHQAMKPR
jgi:hypothetical protein